MKPQAFNYDDYLKLKAENEKLKAALEKSTITTALYDRREVFSDCTVEVWTNTVTGETSIGWWRNDQPPVGMEDEYAAD